MRNAVQRMRSRIARITGRSPTSSDPRYLRARLTELELKLDAGETVRRRGSARASVISVSLTTIGRAALGRIVAREGRGASELVRAALASWARANGYAGEAAAIE